MLQISCVNVYTVHFDNARIFRYAISIMDMGSAFSHFGEEQPTLFSSNDKNINYALNS